MEGLFTMPKLKCTVAHQAAAMCKPKQAKLLLHASCYLAPFHYYMPHAPCQCTSLRIIP